MCLSTAIMEHLFVNRFVAFFLVWSGAGKESRQVRANRDRLALAQGCAYQTEIRHLGKTVRVLNRRPDVMAESQFVNALAMSSTTTTTTNCTKGNSAVLKGYDFLLYTREPHLYCCDILHFVRSAYHRIQLASSQLSPALSLPYDRAILIPSHPTCLLITHACITVRHSRIYLRTNGS